MAGTDVHNPLEVVKVAPTIGTVAYGNVITGTDVDVGANVGSITNACVTST